jgi:hypothetical protein
MISCTEFIPLYSELFKFIEKKAGHDAVVRYWEHISDTYVADRLGPLVRDKGMEGCWEYWSKTLNEEAADFIRIYDEDKQEITSHMRHCPSKGMLLSFKHMEPYHDYCGHCAVLYARVLEKYGIYSERDHSNVDRAECRSRLFVKPE